MKLALIETNFHSISVELYLEFKVNVIADTKYLLQVEIVIFTTSMIQTT